MIKTPLELRGRLPVFDGGTYRTSASAVENTQALFVSRTELRAICLENPDVSLKMLQVVGGRLRGLVGIIEELSSATVRHRLISWLLRQAKGEWRKSSRGVTFTLSASHQEIASQIGTVRELVSRNTTASKRKVSSKPMAANSASSTRKISRPNSSSLA